MDMTDREKIIKGLECCRIQQSGVPPICEACPYADDAWGTCKDMGDLLNDAYEMLKAQEPVEPTIGGDADGPCRNWWYQCGKCKEAIDYHDKYCRNCGQAVK